MDIRITKPLAEEFAAFLEEARSYGQYWVTFREEEGRIPANDWQAFTKRPDAFEHAAIWGPDTRAVAIHDLLPNVYEILTQTEEQMQQSINFYELKTQLAGLGYHAPEVTDQLRQIIANADLHSATVHTEQDGVAFAIELERNDHGDFEVLFNHAMLDTGKALRSFLFEPDVSAAEAICNLRSAGWETEPNLDGPLDDDHIYELNYKMRQRLSLETAPEDELLILKSNTMNTENLNYLQKQLLNLGFGEQMNEALEKQIKSQAPEFTLRSTNEYNKQSVDYTLHYKAGEQNEMYFFNKYDAKLKDNKQTFYINKGSGITAKEAYNLMEGRAVHKELENKAGEKYKAWVVLDKENKTENGNFKLKTFSEGWNYRPERAIDQMDIVGIREEGAREKLMRSLEKGNNHQVEAIRDGKTVKVYLGANPAEHRVDITNWKGEPQQLEHYKKPEQKQAQQPEDAPEKKQSRRRGAKMSV